MLLNLKHANTYLKLQALKNYCILWNQGNFLDVADKNAVYVSHGSMVEVIEAISIYTVRLWVA